MSGVFEKICMALPLLARFSGGSAAALSLSDSRRKAVDRYGNDLDDFPPEISDGLNEAARSPNPVMVESKSGSGACNLFLPIGDCLLILNNAGSTELVDRLRATFREAVPLVARVAGGEAVLFDRDGIRFFSVGPDGRETDKGMGQFTYLGKRAMELGRPVIGPSLLEDGALAVRIPITDHFGIGVNNVVSVKQKKLLAASASNNRARYTFEQIVGRSEVLQQCLKQALQVAGTSSTVLVCGETGTGKELLVQSIHNASLYSDGPFVALNCGAIPPSLIESQLFGHEAGAFTGAQRQAHQGLFEQASGGTLFLDEISEMGLELQSRLLRVLQERELVRIGGKKVIPLNVRVIASTNRDLWQMVASGKFRHDLYYRLNVVELSVPPLRERAEDIALLARHFIEQFRTNFGGFVQDVSEEAIQCLICYPWPGNVRELRNCIERIMNLATHEVIEISDIPVFIREGMGLNIRGNEGAGAGEPATAEERPLTESYDHFAQADLPSVSLKGPAQAVERTVILQALHKSRYNRRRTAEMLGISTTTLWRKMKRLGITAD